VSADSYYPAATCQSGSYGPFFGWKLGPITRAAAGLPATIKSPLSFK
jgi:hypothetical protein